MRLSVAQIQSSVAKGRGFTLVELITVMVIVGILAVAVLPRFFDKNIFDARGFHDQVISTVRYAQKVAIAKHRFVCVDVASDNIKVTYDSTPPSSAHTAITACPGGVDLTSPDGKSTFVITSPSVDVTLGAVNFYFDALGKPSAGTTITVSSSDTITIEAETGYVH